MSLTPVSYDSEKIPNEFSSDSKKQSNTSILLSSNEDAQQHALSPSTTTQNVSLEETTYPEGGLRAWSVAFGSWCALLASLGIMNSLGTFQAYVSTNQLKEYTEGEIGWIFSIYTFLAWFCGIFVGPIFDRYGTRWVILGGSACVVTMLFLLGECTAYWHFIMVFGILGGFGTALLFTPCFTVVGHYFKIRRGNATGLACTGGSIGGIIFPFMLEKLIPEVGFAWTCRILGFICLGLCIIANILIRSRLPPLENSNAYPDLKIFGSMAFALTTVGVFLIEFGLFVPLTYISSYALDRGFSQAFAFQILPIMNAGSFFGRWVPGFLGDTIGRYNMLIMAVALSIISTLCVWLPAGSSTAGLVMFALLFGFASGSGVSLTPVCVGQLCKTEEYGRYYATCYTVVAFGCLTGIPIGGEILQLDGGEYWGLMIFVGACYGGALVALVTTRIQSVGWKINVKY